MKRLKTFFFAIFLSVLFSRACFAYSWVPVVSGTSATVIKSEGIEVCTNWYVGKNNTTNNIKCGIVQASGASPFIYYATKDYDSNDRPFIYHTSWGNKPSYVGLSLNNNYDLYVGHRTTALSGTPLIDVYSSADEFYAACNDDNWTGSGGGSSSTSIVYDSSIPTPISMRFNGNSLLQLLTRSGVGFLSWTLPDSALSDPDIVMRLSGTFADDYPAANANIIEDHYIYQFSDKQSAFNGADFQVSLGSYFSNLKSGYVYQMRLQLGKYVDNVLHVGDVLVCNVVYNSPGTFDIASPVSGFNTSSYHPKDDTSLGEQAGGTISEIETYWTNLSSTMVAYNGSGEQTGTGIVTSESASVVAEKTLADTISSINPFKDVIGFLNTFNGYVQQLNTTISSTANTLTGTVTNYATLFRTSFNFFPPEIWAVLVFGLSLVVILRILGR